MTTATISQCGGSSHLIKSNYSVSSLLSTAFPTYLYFEFLLHGIRFKWDVFQSPHSNQREFIHDLSKQLNIHIDGWYKINASILVHNGGSKLFSTRYNNGSLAAALSSLHPEYPILKTVKEKSLTTVDQCSSVSIMHKLVFNILKK